MLKKLRLKFILINMTIVTIMLCVIFAFLYFSTEQDLEKSSMQMMGSVAMNPTHVPPPNNKEKKIQLPYFSILQKPSGETVRLSGGFFDLSDDRLLDEILSAAGAQQARNGILEDYNLRFLCIQTEEGQIFVFSDMTSERSMLHNLLRTFIFIGCAAFIVFLGISMLLARWAVRPVEKAWVQQKQFVADASHELKTPLTVIMTNAELLHTPQCSEDESVRFSGNVLTMAEQMRGLVESMLDLARADCEDLNGSMQTVPLSALLSNAVLLFEPVFFEKQMPFTYAIDDNINVYGNGVQLKQLADILLDNAAKYASAGGETRLSLRQLSARKCRLEVSNQGEPISEEDYHNLFKRFYRADKARTRSHSYGLGLSIAERIAETHHGQIRVESKNGFNSFSVDLPISNPKQANLRSKLHRAKETLFE